MKRWVMAYETDDPNPAAGKVREDITAHAYDQREHRPVHSITNTYRVAADEQWTRFTGDATRCAQCAQAMSQVDMAEKF
jgi:hypothetical protein